MRALSGDRLQREMVEVLAPAMRAIASSLGPEGRHVIFATGSRVQSARTGSEIARRICSDHYADRLLKETLVDAEREFGDGTARLAVMAGAALREAQRALGWQVTSGQLGAALERYRPQLDAAFAAETSPCGPAEQVLRACGLAPALCDLLIEADGLAGPDGLVSLAEADESRVVAAPGFEFEASFSGTAPLAAMEGVALIVANDILSDFRNLAPVIEAFATRGKALVIVARGLEGNALQLIERNRQAGVVRMAALTPAVAGPQAAEILADLAAATGASLVCASRGLTLDAFRPTMLGRAAQFSFVRGRVRLSGPAGDPAEIALRLASAEAVVQASRYLPFDREQAQKRQARLRGQGAELFLARGPGASETLEAARRALVALRAARQSGVIAGAGLGLERIALRLGEAAPSDKAGTAALAIIDAALRAPGRCLRGNAGASTPCDSGVFDPAGLSRDLLEVALSFATRLAGLEGAVLRH